MSISLMIGATNSGCGKTTLTAGLLRVLHRRDICVQPFKCGPDYIDTQYHTLANGRESVNLDRWLASEEHVKALFNRYSSQADASVVEGVMGLFDGYDRMRGSSAEMAILLDIPVVLILNARSMAYSAAPILYGYKHFNSRLRIAGVIFNQTGSEAHNEFLKSACQDVGITCLGCMPRIKNIEIPSRHLGLSIENRQMMDEVIDRVADEMETHIDIDTMLEACQCTQMPTRGEGCTLMPASDEGHYRTNEGLRISVAHDESFNFIYRDNIDALKTIGNINFFSPIYDNSLPTSDFVYLPGGYPEFFLKELSSNEPMLISIREYIHHGGRLLAECGGMMYLSRSIIDHDGTTYPMVNVFEQDCTMEGMRLHLGYRKFDHHGEEWRGHEFHYSTIRTPDKEAIMDIKQRNAKDEETDTLFLRRQNAIAGYTHLYWGEKNNIFDLFD